MPFATNKDLPPVVQAALPDEAQSLFRAVYNAYEENGLTEDRAMERGWDALYYGGYYRKADGSYCKNDSMYKSVVAKAGKVISAANMEKVIALIEQLRGMEPLLEHLANANKPPVDGGSAEGGLPSLPNAVGKRQVNGDWDIELPIAKADEDQKLVFGWLSVIKTADGKMVVDLQGDSIESCELEGAVYSYVLESREAGVQHERSEGIGKIVESVMLTKEKQAAMGIPEGTVPEGWWVGYKIEDDAVWKGVKNGTYKMFSIGGSGVREA